MKMLEELWYGNIDPSTYDALPSKEYHEAIGLVSRNKEKLQATMTDEQKELFARYAESQRELKDMKELLLFQNSFGLGAKMMLEMISE